MKNSFHFLILKLYHNIAYVFPSYIAPFLLVSQTGWGSLRIKENYWGAIKHALNKFEEWPGTITIFCVVVSVRKWDSIAKQMMCMHVVTDIHSLSSVSLFSYVFCTGFSVVRNIPYISFYIFVILSIILNTSGYFENYY